MISEVQLKSETNSRITRNVLCALGASGK